jgi:hypothetical protein
MIFDGWFVYWCALAFAQNATGTGDTGGSDNLFLKYA